MNISKDIVNEIYDLNQLIKNQKAVGEDERRYMSLLLENGIITLEQFENFRKGNDSTYIIENAVTLGGLFILGTLIERAANLLAKPDENESHILFQSSKLTRVISNDDFEYDLENDEESKEGDESLYIKGLELKRPNGETYAIITYEKDNGLIYLEWNGFLTVDLVKEGSEVLLTVIKSAFCGRILVDNRKVSGPWQAANEWYQEDWNPRATKAGLRDMAIIMSENIFAQLSLQGFAKVTAGVYTTNIFNSDAPAREWLRSRSSVYH